MTAAFAMNMPAPLARCRKAVGEHADLEELVEAAPWAPRKKVSA